ncbi:MAG TPA: SUMF1/EgtB/PvdO family nonheme iron enzyme [Rectinemataceae bacterium]|nr:SUMF1/EgtB/PvdO family nonheme iron enzyme [Rectinemataceae bacterium]
MIRRAFALSLVVAIVPIMLFAHSRALVVGNGDYATSPLRNPANDARDMAMALRGYGFDTTLLIDASRDDMLAALERFASTLAPTDTALFYYSGHGLQVRGSNFLIPVGSDIKSLDEVPFKSVPLDLVLSRLEEAGSATNIVILDACRNNPFPASERSAARGLANVTFAVPGTLVAYATAPGALSADGDSRNGVFTRRLLGRMGTPGLDIEAVLRLVRDDVIADTNGAQVPWSNSSLRGAGFYFVPASADSRGSSAAAVTAASVAGSLAASAPRGIADSLDDSMVQVAAGDFMMGSDSGDSDEKPVHEVKLDAYLISAFETTWADYERFCAATGKPLPADPKLIHAQRPAAFMTWFDACEYCNWLSGTEGFTPAYTIERDSDGKVVKVEWNRGADGYRLPTEAEWEYAARGGAAHSPWRFAGGDNLDTIAWHKGDSGGATAAAGTKEPNALGVYDMAGNVWEWCWDWYGLFGSASTTAQDPLGPESGKVRILRGGGYNTATLAYYSVSNRGTSAPVRIGSDIGFRVARSPGK